MALANIEQNVKLRLPQISFANTTSSSFKAKRKCTGLHNIPAKLLLQAFKTIIKPFLVMDACNMSQSAEDVNTTSLFSDPQYNQHLIVYILSDKINLIINYLCKLLVMGGFY